MKFTDPSLGFDFMGHTFLPTDLRPGGSDSNSAPSSTLSVEGESNSDDSDFSDSVLKYISQMLMEEDMEERTNSSSPDPLALEATEKSLYEVLGEKYPPSRDRHPLYLDRSCESPEDQLSGSFSDYGSSYSSFSNGTGDKVDSESSDIHSGGDDHRPYILQTPLPRDFVFQATKKPNVQSSFCFSRSSPSRESKRVSTTNISELLASNVFSERELMLQFKKGEEEASKFLPGANLLFGHLNSKTMAPTPNRKAQEAVLTDREKWGHLPTKSRGRKNHEREDYDLQEARSNKQLAVSMEEIELSQMFDRLLLCGGGKDNQPLCNLDEIKRQQENEPSNRFNAGSNQVKKVGSNKKEMVDLRNLLVLCAQAVSVNDHYGSSELLKQIKQHSSPFGDGTQRLAHYFATGLEARLAGTGAQICTALSPKRSALEVLKAYNSACPLKRFSIIFANHMILGLAEKATTVHIIDFGIWFGFQWPALIHRLSERPGGPPKLRITGIDHPQSGFRPAERVQETGRWLGKYCERFNIPFEYNGITSCKWETIRIEDLKIDRNELVIVSSLFYFKNLLDETVGVNCPRDAVLKLIRKINPAVFINATISGSYNGPFFVTRFREALFYFLALFDMVDFNLAREDPLRMIVEREFFGREAINIIACEGEERVERPETYKQSQVRTTRAGFKQLPLDPQLMQKLRNKANAMFNNDYSIAQDGHWMLQGWKGRVLSASSYWKPA